MEIDRVNKKVVELLKKRKIGQTVEDVLSQDMHLDNHPDSDVPNNKSNEVMYVIINREEISTAYQDLTGRFPQRSSRGNEYILIGYHYDANCILGIPVKNRTAPVLTASWQKLHNIFKKSGCAPSTWVLDNEISQSLKDAFEANDTKFQLVPTKTH